MLRATVKSHIKKYRAHVLGAAGAGTTPLAGSTMQAEPENSPESRS